MQSCFRDKKLFLIILLNLMSITIYAQSVLKGKVVDQDSLPLPGVNVILKNESYGTVTDVNGDFTLRTQRTLTPKDKVVFSFMGYETKTLSYKESITNWIVHLYEKEIMLDGVVVTALGIKRNERSLGYSTAKLDGNDITRAMSTNWPECISGMAAQPSLMSQVCLAISLFSSMVKTVFISQDPPRRGSRPLWS